MALQGHVSSSNWKQFSEYICILVAYVNAGHETETFRELNAKEGTKGLCSPTHLELGSREE